MIWHLPEPSLILLLLQNVEVKKVFVNVDILAKVPDVRQANGPTLAFRLHKLLEKVFLKKSDGQFGRCGGQRARLLGHQQPINKQIG